ncbi:MAG: TonB-dependent receptor [Sphingobacteriia bacterium]|nr:TonB-dependent receptor [Sphingobacteriia bacterium]
MKVNQQKYSILLILLILVIFPLHSVGQQKLSGIVKGIITDNKNKPLELVNVSVMGISGGTISDKNGNYNLTVPADTPLLLVFSFIGFEKQEFNVKLKNGETKIINTKLTASTEMLPDIIIQDERIRTTNLQRINPKEVTAIPSVTGSIESLIKTLPGVASTNELSSQYSVRGGNYDENLVYVNDIEIYRPFLIRSGQQEGLSFLNSDLTSSILFSSGGFDAKYGDKLSSVLDIQYRNPSAFAASAAVSLLGASGHVEDISKNRKFSHITGIRYKTNQYLLNALETKGDYLPSFLDIQTLLRYQVSKKVEISFLGNIADNKFEFVPQTRETTFGTLTQVKRLTIYFDGQEVDRYRTLMGAIKVTHKPRKNLQLKYILSAFNSDEQETFDIQGQYYIGEVETGLGSSNFGETVSTIGVGTYLEHARNYLNAKVFTAAHKGSYETASNFLTWGLNYQHEQIDDLLNEWNLLDSAGYTLPRPPDQIGVINPPVLPLELDFVTKSDINLKSNRYTGFVQNSWMFGKEDNDFTVTAGIRCNYWDYSNQTLMSPRISVSYHPNWKNDLLFRLAAGYYYQPSFYRELRDFYGQLVNGQKAQKSIHLVAGTDWNLTIWGRPFKFTTEAYYKFLDDLIPYEVDNVRIRYYADQRAKGYTTGLDMKINGEFVPGIESWASLSILKTEEDIYGDFYFDYYDTEGIKFGSGLTENPQAARNEKIEPGFIPRPTDQRFRFSIFFQDYLPMNPTYKMHLALYYGSSLPFGPPESARYQQILRMPTYRRVDIGFSKQILGEQTSDNPSRPFLGMKSLWLSLEIFNLLQVNNTISYIWITDVSGTCFAVPNYLTPRQLNLKIVAQF